MSILPIIPESETLLPNVETRVFEDRPEAAFWVGRVASGEFIEMPGEYLASHILRANVYIEGEGFLPPSSRDNDGGEYDEYDERSLQLAVIENTPASNLKKVVATSRLIIKTDDKNKLPIEDLFPEYFDSQPAEVGSVEGSRLIATHPNQITQHLITVANLRAMDLSSVELGAPYIYGIAEKPFIKFLRIMGFPHEQLTDHKVLSEYGQTDNAAIRFDPVEVLRSVKRDITGRIVLDEFFKEALASQGLGHFDKDFRRLDD